MGALEPISPEVPEENQALANALRTLFTSLEISVRRYAARCHTDPGTLSRYLKGTRVPPWSFIKDLLAHVAEHQERHASEDAIVLLRQLYTRAVGTISGARRTADLHHMLEEADEQAREAASLVRLLQQSLSESQQHIDQLNVEIKSLRAARAMDRQEAGAEVERFFDEARDLRTERDQLDAEVKLLRKQLSEAVSAQMLAEERCNQLERQIESAEEKEREEAQKSAAEQAAMERAQIVETERREADRARLKAEEAASSAAHDFQAAQERIATLQAELAEMRAKASSDKSERNTASKYTRPPLPRRRPMAALPDYARKTLTTRIRINIPDTENFAREKIQEIPTPMPTPQEPSAASNDKGEQSIAARLGFGPNQVLRRVDSAHRLDPQKIRGILKQTFDLQSPEEIEQTKLLLQSMPAYIRATFAEIANHSTRGFAMSDSIYNLIASANPYREKD